MSVCCLFSTHHPFSLIFLLIIISRPSTKPGGAKKKSHLFSLKEVLLEGGYGKVICSKGYQWEVQDSRQRVMDSGDSGAPMAQHIVLRSCL